MRRVMLIGACSAGLLGLAVPATAGEPVAEPAPVGAGGANGSADGSAPPREWDGAPAAGSGQVVVMTLSKPRRQPQPRTASEAELRKHAPAGRPQGSAN